MCIKNCIKCEYSWKCDRLMAWCSNPGCGKGINLYGVEYINTNGKYYFITKEQDFNNEFTDDVCYEGKFYLCKDCWEKEIIKLKTIYNETLFKYQELVGIEKARKFTTGLCKRLQFKNSYKYESPVEEILGKALSRETGDDGACKDNYGNLVYTTMECQIEILNSKYRVDFLLTSNKQEDGTFVLNKPPLVIECDGHDFHEKTKEQAKRDKQRDRDCLLAGYNVMRFTGSEIYNDVEKCIQEIEEYFNCKGACLQ